MSILEPVVQRSRRSWRRIALLATIPIALLTVQLFRDHHRAQQRAEALSLVRAVAAREWPRWQAAHARGDCPRAIGELGGRARELDPWGHALVFVCAKDIGEERIASLGPDGRAGTEDDVRSSE